MSRIYGGARLSDVTVETLINKAIVVEEPRDVHVIEFKLIQKILEILAKNVRILGRHVKVERDFRDSSLSVDGKFGDEKQERHVSDEQKKGSPDMVSKTGIKTGRKYEESAKPRQYEVKVGGKKYPAQSAVEICDSQVGESQRRVIRVGSVEVVPKEEFEQLQQQVERLSHFTEPLPTPTLPTNQKLKEDIKSGTASLHDVIDALSLMHRISATEDTVNRLAGMLTSLSMGGALPEYVASQVAAIPLSPNLSDKAQHLRTEAVRLKAAAESAKSDKTGTVKMDGKLSVTKGTKVGPESSDKTAGAENKMGIPGNNDAGETGPEKKTDAGITADKHGADGRERKASSVSQGEKGSNQSKESAGGKDRAEASNVKNATENATEGPDIKGGAGTGGTNGVTGTDVAGKPGIEGQGEKTGESAPINADVKAGTLSKDTPGGVGLVKPEGKGAGKGHGKKDGGVTGKKDGAKNQEEEGNEPEKGTAKVGTKGEKDKNKAPDKKEAVTGPIATGKRDGESGAEGTQGVDKTTDTKGTPAMSVGTNSAVGKTGTASGPGPAEKPGKRRGSGNVEVSGVQSGNGVVSRSAGTGGKKDEHVSERTSEMLNSRASSYSFQGVSFPEMQIAVAAARDDLIRRIKVMETGCKNSTDGINSKLIIIEENISQFTETIKGIQKIKDKISAYSDLLDNFDGTLHTQLNCFRAQIDQLQKDLNEGIEYLSDCKTNSETAAVQELNQRFQDLQHEIERLTYVHTGLEIGHGTIGERLKELIKTVDLLQTLKADRFEMMDLLHDKADITQLEGLLTTDSFHSVRTSFENMLTACHEKFDKQEQTWMKALADLHSILEKKADLVQLISLREDSKRDLEELYRLVECLRLVVGEPEAAILTRQLSEGASCGVCQIPAHMLSRDPKVNYPPCLPFFPGPREPEIKTKKDLCMDMFPPIEITGTKHICKRWVGGSHTLLPAGTRVRAEKLNVSQAATHRYVEEMDGMKYYMEEELQPCKECNTNEMTYINPASGDQGGC